MIKKWKNTNHRKSTKKFGDIIVNTFHNHKIIYSDGSKSNEKLGIAKIMGKEVGIQVLLTRIYVYTYHQGHINYETLRIFRTKLGKCRVILIIAIVTLFSNTLSINNHEITNEVVKKIQLRASSPSPRSVTFI